MLDECALGSENWCSTVKVGEKGSKQTSLQSDTTRALSSPTVATV